MERDDRIAHIEEVRARIRDLKAKAAKPGLVQKAKNFATAAAQHVAAGLPRCTAAEIEARYAICQACEFLRDGACQKCGCPVKPKQAVVSKLSWADQSCPVGKWGKIETTPPAAGP